VYVTSANEQERAPVANMVPAAQEVTGGHVKVTFVDHGYTGPETIQADKVLGTRLEVVKVPEANIALTAQRAQQTQVCRRSRSD
jgi:hypothetical protein